LTGNDRPNFDLQEHRAIASKVTNEGVSRERNLVTTEPRMPFCQLAIKFRRPDIIKRLLASECTGFYFAVLQESGIGAGDSIEIIERIENSLRVSDITALHCHDKHNVALHRRAIAVETLPESWKDYFRHRLAKLTSPAQD
jgi:MOSC domain-containing protein YiiM